jgi:putative hydrolase of HD superfamily
MFEFLAGYDSRLGRQVEFLLQVDRLKQVERRTRISGGSRPENSAEHSWHAALAALILAEHANVRALNLSRVVEMLLIHDLVEIEAGDTFVYDEHLEAEKRFRESQAAARLFAVLPPDQAMYVRELWEEFEARQTPEAQYAAAVDRLLPILLNFVNRGRLWQEHGISAQRVRSRNQHIQEGSTELWQLVETVIGEAVARGFLPERDAPPEKRAKAGGQDQGRL